MGTMSRRQVLQVTAAGAVVLTMGPRAVEAGPARQVLDARTIRQFALDLPIPREMPGRLVRGRRELTISARPARVRMLPKPFGLTSVFAYGPAEEQTNRFHSVPGPTIVAHAGVPTRVTWVNELVDAAGRPVPHLFAVDPTLHWANPERLPDAEGHRTTDSMPALAGLRYAARTAPGPTVTAGTFSTYAGPVPMVTHLHGAAGVGDESDGYPEAWFLPRTAGGQYAPHGRWYEFFAAKALRQNGTRWTPGRQTCTYPNTDRPAMLWYHDHTMGMTRLSVNAGLVGSYVVRGEDVRDRATGRPAIVAPEIPLVVADRTFRRDGSLWFPSSRADFDGYAGPVFPESSVPPVWNPEVLGNVITVNGAAWPRVTVERRRYRVRLLNACDTRTLVLDLASIPRLRAWQIGTDGGLVRAPVDLTGTTLTVAPAERVDLVVDLADVPPGRHVLANRGPDAPFAPGYEPADAATTGRILAIDVVGRRVRDRSTPVSRLVLPGVAALPRESVVRRVALLEHSHTITAAEHAAAHDAEMPVRTMLGSVHGDPTTGWAHAMGMGWGEEVTETPAVGATEVWQIANLTEDSHPVHVHHTTFEVLDHVAIERDEHTPGCFRVAGRPVRASATQRVRKDTVVVPAGSMTRIRLTFPRAGQFVWHCHILSHEDNEMMRPLRVGPVQPGQPRSQPMPVPHPMPSDAPTQHPMPHPMPSTPMPDMPDMPGMSHPPQ